MPHLRAFDHDVERPSRWLAALVTTHELHHVAIMAAMGWTTQWEAVFTSGEGTWQCNFCDFCENTECFWKHLVPDHTWALLHTCDVGSELPGTHFHLPLAYFLFFITNLFAQDIYEYWVCLPYLCVKIPQGGKSLTFICKIRSLVNDIYPRL